jgi:hypothetical protein
MPSGRSIPLDPADHPEGNLVLSADGTLATIVTKAQLAELRSESGTPVPAYRSHFASCQFAARHRKAGA